MRRSDQRATVSLTSCNASASASSEVGETGASSRPLSFATLSGLSAVAIGVNLEDGLRDATPPIRSLADATARIAAAREAARAAGVPIMINARTDLYIKNIGDEASRFTDAVARGRAYLAAGADCFYPISLRDPATIGRLVMALGAPININVRAGLPNVAELEALGVTRASTATALPLMAMGLVRQAAEQLRAAGRFDAIDPAMTHAEAQLLFADRSGS